MIRSSSLFFVLVVALVIGVLSMNLILLAYQARALEADAGFAEKVNANTLSGENLLLSDSGAFGTVLDKTIDLFSDKSDSVRLKKIPWGIFEVGLSEAFIKKWKRTRIFLMGPYPGIAEGGALYLSDQNRPLTIAGKTNIIGAASLPEAGIRQGFIDGNGFEGDSLVHGAIKRSTAVLPTLNPEIIQPLSAWLNKKDSTVVKKYFRNGLLSTRVGEARGTESYFRFTDTTAFMVSYHPISLAGLKLSGNLVVISKDSIFADSTSELSDVILIAPKIRLGGHFMGTVQAFASDSLSVGPSSTLNYPSALGLIKDTSSHLQPVLSLEAGSTLQGIVFSTAPKQDNNLTYATMGKGTTVEGFVYVNGFLELLGNVTGCVLTDRFIYRSTATTFENNLYNVTLNRKALPSQFVSSSLFETGSVKKAVISYLRK